uniref:peptidylprolyl isomerase n=1 Tax=Arcella intermedia TaxID=1963864 RepID=A0A6B2LCP4_9EUKA
MKEGTPNTIPVSASEVQLHYVGKLSNGTVFDSSRDRNQPLKFMLDCDQVIKGWDMCVSTMNVGEVVRLVCPPEYGYNEGCPPDIPANETITFEEMELIATKKPIDTIEDRIEETNRIKTEGNDFFKKQKYEEAVKSYDKAMDLWKFVFPNDTDKPKVQEAQLPVLLNMAACQLKLKDWKGAWLSCEKSLDIEPNNVKALFRRGQSYVGQNEFTKAKHDFVAAIKLDPKNRDLRTAYADLKKEEEAYKLKQQSLYSKMGSAFN